MDLEVVGQEAGEVEVLGVVENRRRGDGLGKIALGIDLSFLSFIVCLVGPWRWWNALMLTNWLSMVNPIFPQHYSHHATPSLIIINHHGKDPPFNHHFLSKSLFPSMVLSLIISVINIAIIHCRYEAHAWIKLILVEGY